MDKKKLLGKRIKELIKQKNISQEKLAELVGIEPTSLSNIVTGRNYPLLATLERIMEILGVNYNEIFNYEHHKNPEDLKSEIENAKADIRNRILSFYIF